MNPPPVPCRSLLVLGGARSGKSGWAQRAAELSDLSLLFVATGQAFDDEMASRIAAHRAARDARWELIEAPLGLPDVVGQECRPDRLVLVDCATLWLANEMMADTDLAAATDGLVAAMAEAAGPLVVVSNEVGQGIVPASAAGRQFRDAQGRLNAQLAAAAHAVIALQAGLPRQLKPAPEPALAFG